MGPPKKRGEPSFWGGKFGIERQVEVWGFEPEKKRFSWESEPGRLEPISTRGFGPEGPEII